MNPSCPYAHVSYATWRLQALRRLGVDAEGSTALRLTFLQPRSMEALHSDRRNFHGSSRQSRSNLKDVKRTAKYKAKNKAVELELERYVKHGVEPAPRPARPNTSSRSTPRFSEPGQAAEFTPWARSGLEQLQDLVGDLRVMAKEAAAKNVGEEEEGIPFESGGMTFVRKRPGLPDSPLERRLPWDPEKKLRVEEVEVDQRLQNNVWAQMLASPIRMDRGTKARLPRNLLTGWGVMENPKDKKDYLLPIELSDLEALRQELPHKGSTNDAQQSSDKAQALQNPKTSSISPGYRVQIAPNKVLLQAMTSEFIYEKPRRGETPPSKQTNSAKVNNSLVPYRWRHKQGELRAFHKTRQRFYEALDRQPDEDEPNLDEMAKLEKLQWQLDIAERIEKIMRERVIVALEAVGKGNASGRAIHDRKVLAIPVPEKGSFWLDEQGRIANSSVSPPSHGSIQAEEQDTNQSTTPEWLHGAMFLHIGAPLHFHKTVEQWHSINESQHDHHETNLGRLPVNNLMPPMITINDRFRLPVFNLETLFGDDHATRLKEVIEQSEVLTLEFWTKKNGDTAGPQSRDVDSRLTRSDLNVPDSPMDAGAQVLSSILTPQSNTSSSSQPTPPSVSTSTSTSTSEPPNSATPTRLPTEIDETAYLVLIKPNAQHASALMSEIWRLWRYVGGRKGLYLGSREEEEEEDEKVEEEEGE